MDRRLAEALNELDRVRSEAQATLGRMQADLARLSRQHGQATERVMRDNSDQISKTVMLESEGKIREIKKKIADFRRSAHEDLNAMRLEIEARRDARLEALQEELGAIRSRQETLGSELIPQVRAALDGYLEEKKTNDAKTLTLMSQINEIRRQQFSSDLVEID